MFVPFSAFWKVAIASSASRSCCATLAASVGRILPFDQLIEEGTWVHTSFAPAMRRQVLTKVPGGYAKGLAR